MITSSQFLLAAAVPARPLTDAEFYFLLACAAVAAVGLVYILGRAYLGK